MPRMSAPVVRTIAIGLGVVILLILLVVSSGGQLTVVRSPGHAPGAAVPARISPPVTGASGPQGSGDLGPVAVWTGLVLLAAFVIGGVITWLLLFRRVTGGHRRIGATAVPGPPDRLLQAVTDDSDEHAAALRHGTPRAAIIACWTGLEATMARTGLAPDAAETSTELVQRALSTYPIEPDSIQRLAALYREARFSVHDMPETARAEAIGALELLHADLAGVRRGERPATAHGGRR